MRRDADAVVQAVVAASTALVLPAVDATGERRHDGTQPNTQDASSGSNGSSHASTAAYEAGRMRDAARAAVPQQWQQDWQKPGGAAEATATEVADAALATSSQLGTKRRREALGAQFSAGEDAGSSTGVDASG